LSLVAALVSRRARRTVAVIALAEGAVDWWRKRHHPDRPGLPGYLLARRLDDLAYGGGLWWGALRHRTIAPLRPVGTAEARSSVIVTAPSGLARTGEPGRDPVP
jgi:hypothetical protein